MRQRKDFFKRFREGLDIPREALPGGFGLTLSGQGALTVRGCRGILTYSPGEIGLSLGRRVLTVRGSGLLCTVFAADHMTVEGEIVSLSFEEAKHEA